MEKNVPLVVIRRLPRYYRYLTDLKDMGIERVSSQVLSKKLGFTASQVRQDLNASAASASRAMAIMWRYSETRSVRY